MDYLERRRTHLLLWCPAAPADAPQLVIGIYEPALGPSLREERTLALRQSRSLGDGTGSVW